MTAVVDKEMVKNALRELINEEPETFKAILKDILHEESSNTEDKFERLIQKNFKRFEATFKALA